MPFSSNVSMTPRLRSDLEFRLLLFSMTAHEHRLCRRISDTILPSIRLACAERGARLVLIEAQPGALDDDAFSAKHVARILNELQTGAFFIGLVGSHYGAGVVDVGSSELQTMAQASPWLADALDRGLGAGDIVIHEGVLRKPERMKQRAAFFLQRTATHGDDGHSERQWLVKLKRSIGAGDFPIFEFDEIERLAAMIHQCVERWLNIWLPVDEAGTYFDRERQEHATFRDSYCRTYLQRPYTMRELDRHVDEECERLLWVTAPSGNGKTSLLVNWVRRFRDECPQVLLIEHYVGATPSSRNVIGFMRRVLSELKLRFAIAAEIPVRTEEVADAYNVWLSSERRERVVLVIDGIDQFEGLSDPLKVLPAVMAPHLRVIASAASGFDTTRHNDARSLVVPGLTVKELQELMAADFRERYPFQAPAKIARRIATIRAARQAFHSRLANRVLTDSSRTNDEVSAMLEQYERATGPDELIDLILEDMAARCDGLPAHKFLVALWASQYGLTLDELEMICGTQGEPATQSVATLATLFDPILVNHGGLLTLSHAHVINAVERRYLTDTEARRDAHRMLADLFAAMTPNTRRVLALARQLKQAGATRRLYAELSRVETLATFQTEGREHELMMYWNERSGPEIERWYLANLARYADHAGRNSLLYTDALASVAEFLQLAGRFRTAADLLKTEHDILRGRRAHLRTYASCLGRLSEAELALGNSGTALRLLARALGIQKRLGMGTTTEHAKTHGRLASVLDTHGRFGEALDSLNAAAAILHQHLDHHHEWCLRNASDRAVVLFRLEHYDAAEELLRATLSACESTVGEYHMLTLDTLNNLGAVYERQAARGAHTGSDAATEGSPWLAAARGCRERALVIGRRLLPVEHPGITLLMSNLGMQLRRERDYPGAERQYREALSLDIRTLGKLHPRIAALLINLASVLRLQGTERWEEALDCMLRALEIRRQLPEATPLEISDIELNLASLLKQIGRFDEALARYRAGLPARVIRLGLRHAQTREALNGLSDLLWKLGRSYAGGNGDAVHPMRQAKDGTHRTRISGRRTTLARAAKHAADGELATARRLCREVIARHVRNGKSRPRELMHALELLTATMKPPAL